MGPKGRELAVGVVNEGPLFGWSTPRNLPFCLRGRRALPKVGESTSQSMYNSPGLAAGVVENMAPAVVSTSGGDDRARSEGGCLRGSIDENGEEEGEIAVWLFFWAAR